MNPDRLLNLYNRISDAPDAIPRLRRFVLDLAVRGKLVEQDPTDEPAAKLLKRIAKEKARLEKAGEIKKSEVDELAADDEPFALPKGWAWTRLGSIGDWGAGSTPSRGNSELYGGSVTWLKSGELNDNTALSGSEETVTEEAVKKGSFRVNKSGDVLIAMYGATIGKLAILAETAVTNQAVCGCTPFVGVTNRFLFLFLLSYRANFHAASEGGAQPNISKIKIVSTPFPVPPLAEQQRIVAKVDELMALCDRLQAAQAGREAVRDRLTAATLARLTAPETDAETFPTHARFALQSLPSLTTHPDQIKTLRQTILNLAVRGKLVEQDPTDEPAAELLKRIREWQNTSVSQKKIRAPRKPLRKIEEGDQPYPLPNGWAFARLGEIIYIQSGDGLTAANMKDGPHPVFGGNGINGYHDCYNVRKATLVVGRVGYYCGSVHVTPEKAWVTDNAFITHFSEKEVSLSFLAQILKATNLKEDENATAQPVISGSKIYPLVVGLPPLAEQHRIVAKVEALMALCDQLEASLTTATTTRSRLLEALLHEALGGALGDQAEAAA